MQVYANIPLPLASALDLESGETVTWKVLDRTHLLLVRLPEWKQLKGEAVPQPPPGKGWETARGWRRHANFAWIRARLFQCCARVDRLGRSRFLFRARPAPSAVGSGLTPGFSKLAGAA